MSNNPFIVFKGGEYRLGFDPSERDLILRRWPTFGSDWISDSPARAVLLEPFRMSRDPVSSDEFARFLNDVGNGHAHGVPWFWEASPYATIRRTSDGRFDAAPNVSAVPVSGVSFEGAREYARYRGARLPSEEEWEVAARATIRLFNDWNPCEGPGGHANGFDCEYPPVITNRLPFLDGRGPVDVSFLPEAPNSVLGIIGNLWEWCVGTTADPALRGGSWNDIVPLVFHPAFRHKVPRHYRVTHTFGLRLADTA